MYTDQDDIKLLMCDPCILHEKTKNDVVVFIDGAPAGFVKGTHNPCKNSSKRDAFRKDS